MDRPRFVIEATEAETLAKQSGFTSVHDLLPSLVKSAKQLARPFISNYNVGAVGIGSSGRVYVGVNVEFPGLPLNQTVHAEQFLVTNLFLNAEPSLKCFAVSSAPCGHCRQFLQEIRHSPDIRVLITGGDGKDAVDGPLTQLLPHRFGPDDLLDKDVPLLLEPHNNNLILANDHHAPNGVVSSPNELNGINGAVSLFNDLKQGALEAANNSHAHYSKCPSGVALMDRGGNVYKGSYMESAAYNPSLGPVQAALIAYMVGGGGRYDGIVAAALVEKGGAAVKQENTARLILQEISPKCEFKVFHCKN